MIIKAMRNKNWILRTGIDEETLLSENETDDVSVERTDPTRYVPHHADKVYVEIARKKQEFIGFFDDVFLTEDELHDERVLTNEIENEFKRLVRSTRIMCGDKILLLD